MAQGSRTLVKNRVSQLKLQIGPGDGSRTKLTTAELLRYHERKLKVSVSNSRSFLVSD